MVKKSYSADERAQLFQKHYIRFWGEVGSIVFFQRGPNRGKKRARIPWTVIGIETDPEKCTWAKSGRTPYYIHLKGMLNGKEQTLWTCETQLVNTGVKDAKVSTH